MAKILALIDGSIYSEAVCDHAAWVAAGRGWPVELVHVIGRREEVADPRNLSREIGLGRRDKLLDDLAELDAMKATLSQLRGRAILDDAEARIRHAGVEVGSQLRIGDLVDTLRELEKGTGLIIAGKRGEAANYARSHLGSNLERAVRGSRKPFLVASRPFRPVRRILAAFDGGLSALKAVDHIARSALFTGLDIHLLTVGPETEAARASIEGAAAMLRGAGYTARTEIVDGLPETEIARRAEAADFDLLVMGAYGHSRIRTLLIGSTTTQMIRSCHVPVLLFR